MQAAQKSAEDVIVVEDLTHGSDDEEAKDDTDRNKSKYNTADQVMEQSPHKFMKVHPDSVTDLKKCTQTRPQETYFSKYVDIVKKEHKIIDLYFSKNSQDSRVLKCVRNLAYFYLIALVTSFLKQVWFTVIVLACDRVLEYVFDKYLNSSKRESKAIKILVNLSNLAVLVVSHLLIAYNVANMTQSSYYSWLWLLGITMSFEVLIW